ncbi:MAG: hypothetical protein RB191_25020 [Terriglobia bacterium]|nr:hypothetical protein [Terriglobia bacterium]
MDLRWHLNRIHRGLTAIAFLLIAGCSSEDERALEKLQQQLDQAQAAYSNDSGNCSVLRVAQNQAEGDLDEGDIDIAVAKNLDHVTLTQERAYRREVAAELDMLPSQANGWKQVLKGRADTAKAERPTLEQEFNKKRRAADEACRSSDTDANEVARLQEEVFKLQSKINAAQH